MLNQFTKTKKVHSLPKNCVVVLSNKITRLSEFGISVPFFCFLFVSFVFCVFCFSMQMKNIFQLSFVIKVFSLFCVVVVVFFFPYLFRSLVCLERFVGLSLCWPTSVVRPALFLAESFVTRLSLF